MKAFVSWSGGKDCMLALYRFLQEHGNEVSGLINMCDDSSELSRSHGLSREIIARQAAYMGILINQQTAGWSNYEEQFKKAIAQLKTEGATAGVFGDIYLMEHRTWIERVCSDMGIEAIFPLWNCDTKDLLREFIDAGFKALTVSVHTDKLPQSWLGRELDINFFNDITALEGIDACAEEGEYHSFVCDGPLFKQPVSFVKKGTSEHNNHYFLEIAER
jgi:diphthine-ammonia ligase